MSVISPDYGTGSLYYSQNYDNIQELLQRLYDNNTNVILAKDVRDPLWTLWNKIVEIGSQSGSASLFYTLGTPSTADLGGILEGSTFSNATLTELFDKLLLPYVAPVVQNFGPSVVEKQFGDTTTLNLTYSINVGSKPLDGSYAIQFISPNPSSPISNKVVTGNDPETGTTNNFSLTYSTIPSITQTFVATMSFRTTDLNVFSSTASIVAKHKRYYGKVTIPGGFTPSSPSSVAAVSSFLTDTVIKGLSYSELSTNVNFSQAIDFSSGQYFVFAAPTIFGFNYPVGFYVDNIFNQDVTKIRSNSTFINENGYQTPYDVFIIDNSFDDSALISTIPLPQGYLSNNFLSVINSVIIGDQGPQGPTGSQGPSVTPGGVTWSFQLNDGSGGLTGVGYYDYTNSSVYVTPLFLTSSNTTVFGHFAGTKNRGNNNTFLGFSTGPTNSTGNSNTFIGSNSGLRNTTGSCNTFIGVCSGATNSTGSANVRIGFESGFNNQTGSSGVSIGFRSGYNSTSGSNVFIGSLSGFCNTFETCNTYIGTNAGQFATGSCENTFVGFNAGRCSSSSTNGGNTFIGSDSGVFTTGFYNTAVGNNSLRSNTSGNYNVSIGQSSGSSNTTGFSNVYIGQSSGGANTIGSSNIYIGRETAKSSIQDSNNTYVGVQSGCLNIGSSNTFIGSRSGHGATGIGCSIFIGSAAGCSASRIEQSVIIGNCAGIFSCNGSGSIIIGCAAGLYNSASYSVFVGADSGYCNSGARNTFIGNQSGFCNTAGTGNTYLGFCSGRNASFSSSIAIGSCASITRNNQLSIGSSTDFISLGTTASNLSAYCIPATASSFLCVTLNGTDYKLPLFI